MVKYAPGFSKNRFGKLTGLLAVATMFATWPLYLPAYQDVSAPASAEPPPPPGPTYVAQTPEQLQQLVAPVALYPDSLVAQILAASAFPDQIVLADRWLQAQPDLEGAALGQAVDQQQWDPSVKALTAFPTVLGNMDKNLSWTSSLGDAYYNQQQQVMDAVQGMRESAQAAGTLTTTPQQNVTTQGSTIVIEPATPDVVYVPAYDPWVVYGAPIVPWPYWYPYPGIWYEGPFLSFGIGFRIGFFGGFGWGWGHWEFDWHNRYPVFDHGRYFSHSNTFYNRNAYYRRGGQPGVAARVTRGRGEGAEHGGLEHGGNAEHFGGSAGDEGRSGATRDGFAGRTDAARGYAQPGGESGMRSSAFSGYDYGGQARSFSSRGSASFGREHAGGGGGHAGGGRH